MAKTVKLYHPIIGIKEFAPDHATALMAMERNGGWQWHESGQEKTEQDNAIGDQPDQGNTKKGKRKKKSDK